MPIGATYIYNLNFFAGIIVASLTYYLLCRFFPIPATSDHWMEVGDEIRHMSVAYGADDVESGAGSESPTKEMDSKVLEGKGVEARNF